MDSTSFLQNRVTVGKDGKTLEIPHRVIKSVTTARSIYYTLRQQNLGRNYLYAEIDGLIAGNPPYDIQELKNAGLLHIANFNTLEPMALWEKNAQSYWNLLFTSEYVINFGFNLNDPQAPAMADILSQHWDEVVREYWPSFDINVSVLTGQLVKYGLSPVVWVDESSPFWRVVETNKFFVADQSASDMDLLGMCCTENEYSIVYLLEIYNEFKDKRDKTFWNIDVLEKFLLWKANSPYKDNPLPTDWVELQRKLYQGDLQWDQMYNETVRIVSLFYKEGNGEITHFMFHRDWQGRHPVEDGFLYIEEGQYKSFDELFLLFTQNPGQQYIHGNRGLGQKIFPLSQAKMMMDNSLVDGGRWASTPIVKSPSMTVKEAESVRFTPGVMTNIGSMEFQQNNLGANLQGIIATSQYLAQMLEKNAAYNGDNSGMPDSSNGSLAPEVFQYTAYKEFNVLRNQISHFYKTFDRLLKQMVIRMLDVTKADDERAYEMAQEWKNRCIEDGFPEELFQHKKGRLPKYWKVKATRTAGAGSQLGHLVGLKMIEPLVGTFGKKEQINYIQDRIKAAVGPEFVERYTDTLDNQDELGGGGSLAQLENNAMQGGQQALAEPSNDNQTHITIHLALGKQIEDALTQGQMTAPQADPIFAVLIPHIQQHVQFLSTSIFAKSFLEGIKPQITSLTRRAELNRRNAQNELRAQAQKEEAAQQKLSAEQLDQQRKDMVAQAEQHRKDLDAQAKNKRADDAHAVKAEQLRRKTDAEVQAIQTKAEAESHKSARDQLTDIVNSGSNTNTIDFA